MTSARRDLSYGQFVQELKNDLLRADDSLEPALNLHSDPLNKLIEATAYRFMDMQSRINHILNTVASDLNPAPVVFEGSGDASSLKDTENEGSVIESVGSDDWVIQAETPLPVTTGQYITVNLKDADNLPDGTSIKVRSYQSRTVYDIPESDSGLIYISYWDRQNYPTKTEVIEGTEIESTVTVNNGIAKFTFKVPYGTQGSDGRHQKYRDGKLHLIFDKNGSNASLALDLVYKPADYANPSGSMITSSVPEESLTPGTQTRIILNAPQLPDGAWVAYGATALVTWHGSTGRAGVRGGQISGGTYVKDGIATFNYTAPTRKTNNEKTRYIEAHFIYKYNEPGQIYMREEFNIPINPY